MQTQRRLEIDALRGIAALAVVFYHYFYHYNQLYGHQDMVVQWAYAGKFGVQLFFIISGFVIYWTLNRTLKPLDFIISRFSRLYPAYWCAVLVTFFVVSYFGLPGREVSVADMGMNLLMFQEYLRIPHVDGVYWTLSVELAFYFLVFMFFVSGALRLIDVALLGLISLSVLHSTELLTLPSAIHRLLILKYIPFFAAGICFYRLSTDSKTSWFNIAVLGYTLLSTLAIYSPVHTLVFSFIYVVFYLAISGRAKFLALSGFVFIGNISYALYLVHQNIGYVIINQFYAHGLSPYLGIALALLVSFSLAIAISRLVEKPALHAIRSRYQQGQSLQGFANRLLGAARR